MICGEVVVEVWRRGLSEQLWELDCDSVSFARALDGTSHATFTLGENCAHLLHKHERLRHEVVVKSDQEDEGQVWTGPILHPSYDQSGQAQIIAGDLSTWLGLRLLRDRHTYTEDDDALDVFLALWHDAIDQDNAMRFELDPGERCGAGFPLKVRPDQHTLASDALQPISDAYVDWTVINRHMHVGAPDRLLMGTITDQDIAAVPPADLGALRASRVTVIGQGRGASQNVVSGAARRGDLEEPGGIGLVDVVVNDSLARSSRVCRRRAASILRRVADPPPLVSEIPLVAQSAIKIRDVVPGRLVDVNLSQPVDYVERLRVKGYTYSRGSDGSVSQAIQVQPIGDTPEDVAA